jgi:gluconate 2-dehydrogenase gamma chain
MTRRDILQSIAAAALAGPVTAEAAQHVHETVAQQTKATGTYKAVLLKPHEYDTLKLLCEIIVPGAEQGGAAQFIDTLSSQNPEMAAIYTGGIAWLDSAMRKGYGTDFLMAKPEQRTAMLDTLAYRKNASSHPELAPGFRFFNWVRRMTVDAYYTSAAGIKEIGFKGNGARAEFTVPQDAIDYAVKRSPFA